MLAEALIHAQSCLASETDAKGFDFIDDGRDTGVWWGLTRDGARDRLTFRGSELIVAGLIQPDWFRDFDAEVIAPLDFAGQPIGRVHGGMFENMPEVCRLIMPQLRPRATLDIDGHSLGAARACYAARYLPFSELYLFGCPKPGDQQFADFFSDKTVVNFKNLGDIVTMQPPREWPFLEVHDFYDLAGIVDHSLGPLIAPHHIINYVEGIKNAIAQGRA